MTIKLKRVYEDVSKADGVRILVDRVWPRGISKEKAKLDEWLKEIGPSTELRKWFNHESDKYDEFKKKYKDELKDGDQKKDLDQLKDIIKDNSKKTVTLLYAAKDEEHNQAQVLKEIVDKK